MEEDRLVFETSKGVEPISSFAEMGIKDDLLRGIYQYGFEKPSAIQQRAVLPIISGRDVIAQAQSGTGKTSMIALTVCQVVDTKNSEYVFSFPLILAFFGLIDGLNGYRRLMLQTSACWRFGVEGW